MCDHNFEMSSANWLRDSGFFLEAGSDKEEPGYRAIADNPAQLIAMQIRMAQRIIEKKRTDPKD